MSEFINDICHICYNNERHHKLKCNTCNHDVCNTCFSRIIFNGENFNDNYMNDITLFRCPFCTNKTTFTIKKMNHYNINDKLVKLSIKKNKKYYEDYNNMINDNIKIVDNNNFLINEVHELNNEINNLNIKIIDIQDKKLVIENILVDIKQKKTKIKNKLIEANLKIKNISNYSAIKYDQIITLLNNTKRKTVLFDQINQIINS